MATDLAPAASWRQTSDLRRVLRNAIALTSADWVIKLTNFAFTIFIVRRLGEVGYGSFASVAAWVGLFGVLFELGLSEWVLREIARDRRRLHDLFWNLVAIRLILALPGLLAIPVLASVAGYDQDIVFAVALHTATFVFSAVLIPLLVVLAAHERLDIPSRLAVVMNLIYIGVGGAVLLRTSNYYALIAVAFLTMPVHILLAVRAVRQAGIVLPALAVSPRAWKGFVRAGLPFALSSLALTYNFRADVVLLGLLGSAAAVGWYSAAYRLIFSLSSMVAGFTRAMTPTLSRLHSNDADQAMQWVRAGVMGLAFFTLPAAVGLSLLSSKVVALLYGANYGPSGTALAILAWDLPLLAVCGFGGNAMTATNRERSAARAYVIGAVINVASNVLLIPRFGLVAAAAITVSTDGIILLGLFVPIWRTIAQGTFVMRLIQLQTAAALMGVVVWACRDLPLPVSVAAGAGTYLALCAAWRLPDVAAWQWAGRQLWSRHQPQSSVVP